MLADGFFCVQFVFQLGVETGGQDFLFQPPVAAVVPEKEAAAS